MEDSKFRIGDIVKFKESSGIFNSLLSYEVVNRWTINGRLTYRLAHHMGLVFDEMIELVDKPIAINIIYTVEGIEYDTLEEAKQQVKRVKIFNLLEDCTDMDVLHDIVDAIINKQEMVKAILLEN